MPRKWLWCEVCADMIIGPFRIWSWQNGYHLSEAVSWYDKSFFEAKLYFVLLKWTGLYIIVSSFRKVFIDHDLQFQTFLHLENLISNIFYFDFKNSFIFSKMANKCIFVFICMQKIWTLYYMMIAQNNKNLTNAAEINVEVQEAKWLIILFKYL